MSSCVRGTLYILTAPSGAGKTTLARALVTKLPAIQLSISYTTRPMRPGEQNGIHYEFIDETQFQTMIAQAAFLEYASVHGYQYGTSKAAIEKSLHAGIDMVLAIDWQGAQSIREQYARTLSSHTNPSATVIAHHKTTTTVFDPKTKEIVSIFILPPSPALLRQRLELRGQDQPDVIEKRLAVAAEEIAHYPEFDYLVVNDCLEEATLNIQAIVRAHRLRRPNQTQQHAKLLAQWLGEL